jgi:alpha-methylacyl-CoA racemase
VADHPHNSIRATFVTQNGVQQPAPAPRFSRTRPELPPAPHEAGRETHDILAKAGYGDADIAKLEADGVVGRAN